MPYLESLKTTAMKDAFSDNASKAKMLTNSNYTATITLKDNEAYASIIAKTYQPGEYMGLTLPTATRLASVLVSDTLCQNHAVLYSANGHDWTRIEPTGSDTKSIDGYVKHIIVGNDTDAPQSFKVTKTLLKLTLMAEPTIESITAPVEKDYNERSYIYDNDLTTFWCPYANQATGDVIKLNLSAVAPIRKVRFALHNTNGDYMKTGRIEISEDGTKWTKLSPVGSSKSSFTLNDMTPVDGSGNTYLNADGSVPSDCYIYQLYFNGKNQNAQYVRFYNQSPNTSKWCRFAEFYPIYDITASACEDYPEICDGLPYTCDTFNEATYYMMQAADLESVTVYTDEKSVGDSVLGSDNGQDFFTLGTLNSTVSTIDLSEHPNLRLLTISSSESVKVYEVVATTAATYPSHDFFTSIRNIMMDSTSDSSSSTNVYYDMMGRKVSHPAHGLFIQGGKKIYK